MNTKLRNCIFLFVVLLSSYFIYSTFSRNSTRLSGIGTISIAKWDVSVDASSDNSVVLSQDNQTDSYLLKINNNSEVASKYSITISNVPSGVSLSLDDGEAVIPSNGNVVFSDVGTFYVDDNLNSHNHKLTFIYSDDASEVNEQELDIEVEISQYLGN